MAHSSPRGSFLRKRCIPTRHQKQPGIYSTCAQKSAVEAFLAYQILPDYLHSKGTEVGTHSMKFICPSTDVANRMRWFTSERLSVVHGGSVGGEGQCGGEMSLTLDLTSCNDGTLTLGNSLHQHFAGHLGTAFVKRKKKCCPFCLGWGLGEREGRNEIFLGRWKIWKMKESRQQRDWQLEPAGSIAIDRKLG